MEKSYKEGFDIIPYLNTRGKIENIKNIKLPSGFTVSVDMQLRWELFVKEYGEVMKGAAFEVINYDYATIAMSMIINGCALYFEKEVLIENRSIDLVTEIGGKKTLIEVKTRVTRPTPEQMSNFNLDCLSKNALLWVILIERNYLARHGLTDSQIQIIYFVLQLFRNKYYEVHQTEDFDIRENLLPRALSELICYKSSDNMSSFTLERTIANDNFKKEGYLKEFLSNLNIGLRWINNTLITPLAMIKKLEQLYDTKTTGGLDFEEEIYMRKNLRTLSSRTTLVTHVFNGISNLEMDELIFTLKRSPEYEGIRGTLINFVLKVSEFFYIYNEQIKKLDELGRILEVFDTVTKTGGETTGMLDKIQEYREIISSIPYEHKLTLRINLKVLLDDDEVKMLGIGNKKEKYNQRTWDLRKLNLDTIRSFMDDVIAVDCYDDNYDKIKNPYPKNCPRINDLFEKIKEDHKTLEGLKSEILTRTEAELYDLINQRHNVSARGDEISSIRMDSLGVRTKDGIMKKWVITSPAPNSMTSGVIIEVYKRKEPPKWWEQNAIHIGEDIWITMPRRQNYAQVSDSKSLQLGAKALRAFYVSQDNLIAADSFLPILFCTNYQRSLRAFADLSFFLYKCHNATLLTSNETCEEKFGDINTCKLKAAFLVKSFCSGFKDFYAIHDEGKGKYRERTWKEMIDPLLGRKYTSIDEFLMMIFLKSTFMPTSDGFDRLFLLSKACLSEAKYNSKWRNSPNRYMKPSDNTSVKDFLIDLFRDHEWQYYTGHMGSIDEAIKYHYNNRKGSTSIDIGTTVMTDKLNPTAMLNMTPGRQDDRLINLNSEKQSVSIPVLENEAKRILKDLVGKWNIDVDNISLTYLETACILDKKYPKKTVIHMDLKTNEKNYDKRDFYIVMANSLMLAREVEAFMLKVLRDDPFDVITLSGEYKVLKIQEVSDMNGRETIVMMEDMDKFGQTYLMVALKRYLISLYKYKILSKRAACVGVNLIEKLEGRFMILPKEVTAVLKNFRSGKKLKSKHMNIIAGIEEEILETDYSYFQEFKLDENEGYTIERGFVLGLLNFLGSIGTLLSRVICKYWFESMGIYDSFRALTHSDDIATWIKLFKPLRYRKPSEYLIKYIESGKKFNLMQNRLFFDDGKEVDMREMVVIMSYLSILSTRIVGLRMSLNKFAVGPDEMLQYYNINNEGHQVALSKMITSSVKIYGDSYKQDITKTSTGLWSSIVNGLPGYSFEFINHVSQLGIRELYGFPSGENLVRIPVVMGGINFASYGKVLKNGFAEYYFRMLVLSERSMKIDRLMRIVSTDRIIWKHGGDEQTEESEGIMGFSKDWLITKHYKRDLPKTDEYINIQLKKLLNIIKNILFRTHQMKYTVEKLSSSLTLIENYLDYYKDSDEEKHNLEILEKVMKKVNRNITKLSKLGIISNIRFLSQLVAVVSKKVDKSSPGRIIRVCKGYRNRTILNDLDDDFKLNNSSVPGIFTKHMKIKEMLLILQRICEAEIELPSRNMDMLREIYKVELYFSRSDYETSLKPVNVRYIWTFVKVKEMYDNMPIELVSRFMLYKEEGTLNDESFITGIGQKYPSLASYSSDVYLALQNLVSIFSKYGVKFNFFMDNIEIFEKFINIRRRNLIMRSPFHKEFLDVTNGNYFRGGSNLRIVNSSKNFIRNIEIKSKVNAFSLHMFFTIFSIETNQELTLDLVSNTRKFINGNEITLDKIRDQVLFDKINYEKAQQTTAAMILCNDLPYVRFRTTRFIKSDEMLVDLEMNYKKGSMIVFYKYRISANKREKKKLVNGSVSVEAKGFNSVKEIVGLLEWWWIVNSIQHVRNHEVFKTKEKSGNVFIDGELMSVSLDSRKFGNTKIMILEEADELPEWKDRDPNKFEVIGEFEIVKEDKLEFKVRNFGNQKDYFFLPWSYQSEINHVTLDHRTYNPIQLIKEQITSFNIPMLIENSIVKLTYLYIILFEKTIVWEEVISAYLAACRIWDLVGGIDNSLWRKFRPTEEEVIYMRNNGESLVTAMICLKRGIALRNLMLNEEMSEEDVRGLGLARMDIENLVSKNRYTKSKGEITMKEIERFKFSYRGLEGKEIINPKVLSYMISSNDNYEANILECWQSLEYFCGINCGRIDKESSLLINAIVMIMPKAAKIIFDINQLDITIYKIPSSPMRYYDEINYLEGREYKKDMGRLSHFFRNDDIPEEGDMTISDNYLGRIIRYLNPGRVTKINLDEELSSDDDFVEIENEIEDEDEERMEDENIFEFNQEELEEVAETIAVEGEDDSDSDIDDDEMTIEEAKLILGEELEDEDWGINADLEYKKAKEVQEMLLDNFNPINIRDNLEILEEEYPVILEIVLRTNNFWEEICKSWVMNIMPVSKIRVIHELAKKYGLRVILESVAESEEVTEDEDYDIDFINKLLNF